MIVFSSKFPLLIEKLICSTILDLEDYDDELLCEKGDEFFNTGQFKKAIKLYSKAIKLQPDEPNYYINRGLAYHEVFDHRRASFDFSKALEIKPHRHIFFNRGNSYFNLKEYGKAISDYSKSLELDPLDYEVYFHRATGFVKLGNNEQALSDFRSAINLSSNDNKKYIVAYIKRGELYTSMKKYNLAIRDFSRALRYKRGQARVYGLRGIARFLKGDIMKALDDFERKKHFQPEYKGPVFNDELYDMYRKRIGEIEEQ